LFCSQIHHTLFDNFTQYKPGGLQFLGDNILSTILEICNSHILDWAPKSRDEKGYEEFIEPNVFYDVVGMFHFWFSLVFYFLSLIISFFIKTFELFSYFVVQDYFLFCIHVQFQFVFILWFLPFLLLVLDFLSFTKWKNINYFSTRKTTQSNFSFFPLEVLSWVSLLEFFVLCLLVSPCGMFF
jgi:hypothetical protein